MTDFTQEGNIYVTELTSSGTDIIQLESEEATINIFVKIEDSNHYDQVKTYYKLYNQLVQINLKEGMKIKLVSNKPAKYSIKND